MVHVLLASGVSVCVHAFMLEVDTLSTRCNKDLFMCTTSVTCARNNNVSLVCWYSINDSKEHLIIAQSYTSNFPR